MDSINTVVDMGNAWIEHSLTIKNIYDQVITQMRDSVCKLFMDSVQYRWAENDNRPVQPDISINCDCSARKVNYFTSVPRFIIEVLSDSTEKLDTVQKKELYLKMQVREYWIVDWRKRKIEVNVLKLDEESDATYYDSKVITDSNKSELCIETFPMLQVDFDKIFIFD